MKDEIESRRLTVDKCRSKSRRTKNEGERIVGKERQSENSLLVKNQVEHP